MAAHSFKVTSVILLLCHMVRSHRGTTPNFEEIFKGRCLDYSLKQNGGLTTGLAIDCKALWSNFSSVWESKDPCAIGNNSYDQVFGIFNQTLPVDKSLFWSGTKDLAHRLSNNGRRYFTLEDTLPGFIVDSLTWCGQAATPGINYKSCPAYNSCSNEVVSEYWEIASKWFASVAKGEIRVLLNGSDSTRETYRRDSIFGSIEIVNLRKDSVTKVTALVVHDLNKNVTEKCGSKSLLKLKADVLSRNISFYCLENPLEVKYLLCVDTPSSPECISCDDNATTVIGPFAGVIAFSLLLATLGRSLFVNHA